MQYLQLIHILLEKGVATGAFEMEWLQGDFKERIILRDGFLKVLQGVGAFCSNTLAQTLTLLPPYSTNLMRVFIYQFRFRRLL